MMETDFWRSRIQIVKRYVLHSEKNRSAGIQARLHQVLDYLVLRVDHDRAPAGQLGERDAVRMPAEAQIDAMVHEALALQALSHSAFLQQIDSSLFKHAGAEGGFDLLAAAGLEHHRLDA